MSTKYQEFEAGKIKFKIRGDELGDMDTVSLDVIIAGKMVGRIFVDLLKDSENIESEHYEATGTDEWIVQYQSIKADDPEIVVQGNI
jgi:hypothetical protein